MLTRSAAYLEGFIAAGADLRRLLCRAHVHP